MKYCIYLVWFNINIIINLNLFELITVKEQIIVKYYLNGLLMIEHL